MSSEKTRAGRFRKRRGESQSFLLGDADQESETRMSKNALRTGRRQAVESEVDVPLCRFRRQYEQLTQFETGRIIGMLEAGWSARRVARSLGRSDCVVRRCWDQWIREISFTRRPGSEHPRQTSRREESHVARNTRVQPTVSSAAIQAQVAPSLGTPVSSRNHAKAPG
ncbi:transposable element Tcb2 transposase [Trichonephila clavipes]|nr:transposable element Tcb2 transposase [Trichonephila clavipes]